MKRAAEAAVGDEPASICRKSVAQQLRLRHRYFSLRHGESEANVAGIIIGDPEVGTQRYGLTSRGREAVVVAAEKFASSVLGLTAGSEDAGPTQLPRIHIYASDFVRTQETAKIFATALGQLFRARALPDKGLDPRPTPALRERQFGELEGGPNTRYDEIWAVDLKDPSSRPLGAESANAVRARTADVVKSIESEAPGPEEGIGAAPLVVLVSHGDALQLLQTAFLGKSAAEHRSLEHLNPADLRELHPQGEGFRLLCASADAVQID